MRERAVHTLKRRLEPLAEAWAAATARRRRPPPFEPPLAPPPADTKAADPAPAPSQKDDAAAAPAPAPAPATKGGKANAAALGDELVPGAALGDEAVPGLVVPDLWLTCGKNSPCNDTAACCAIWVSLEALLSGRSCSCGALVAGRAPCRMAWGRCTLAHATHRAICLALQGVCGYTDRFCGEFCLSGKCLNGAPPETPGGVPSPSPPSPPVEEPQAPVEPEAPKPDFIGERQACGRRRGGGELS